MSQEPDYKAMFEEAEAWLADKLKRVRDCDINVGPYFFANIRKHHTPPEPLVPVTLDTALIQSLDESFEWSEDTNRKWQHRFALTIAQAVRMSREAA